MKTSDLILLGVVAAFAYYAWSSRSTAASVSGGSAPSSGSAGLGGAVSGTANIDSANGGDANISTANPWLVAFGLS